jgi:hypothetical protein
MARIYWDARIQNFTLECAALSALLFNIQVGMRARESVQRLVNVRKPFPESDGVPPAKILESMPRSFFVLAAETAALPGRQPLDSL